MGTGHTGRAPEGIPSHTGRVPPSPADLRPTTGPHGVVRLLNTAGGRAMCLAGAVDADVVDAFRRRYGREPVRVDVIDAGSVTSLSGAALELVRDHLDVAALGGRTVRLRRSPAFGRLFAQA